MMEDQPPLTSPERSNDRNTPEQCSHLLYSRNSIQEGGINYQENLMLVIIAEPKFKEEQEEVPINTEQDKSAGCELQKLPKSWHSNDSSEEDEEESEDDEGAAPTIFNINVKLESEEEKGEEAEMEIKVEDDTAIAPVDLQWKTSQDYRIASETRSKDCRTVWTSDDLLEQATKISTGPKILSINHQTVADDKPFSCGECGGLFKHRSSLVLHRRIHSGEKPYSCSECGKQFIQKANYLRHQRLHTGEKPYKCTECGKEYAQKQSLVMHQKFHAENEPFSCPECSARFFRQSHLVNHRKTHKGLRRYTCPDCGDFFMLRSSLVIHQKIHSAEKLISS